MLLLLGPAVISYGRSPGAWDTPDARSKAPGVGRAKVGRPSEGGLQHAAATNHEVVARVGLDADAAGPQAVKAGLPASFTTCCISILVLYYGICQVVLLV